MGEAVAGVGHSLEQLVERLKKRYDPEIDTKILNVYLSGSRFVLPSPSSSFCTPLCTGDLTAWRVQGVRHCQCRV
jgi:hypothetical protein